MTNQLRLPIVVDDLLSVRAQASVKATIDLLVFDRSKAMLRLSYEVIYGENNAILCLLADLNTLEEESDCQCHELQDALTSFDVFTKSLVWAQELEPFTGDKVSLYYQLNEAGQPCVCYWFRDCCSGVSCYRELYQITTVPQLGPTATGE